MAQWIAHQTSNLGVAGSNPVENAYFFVLFFFWACLRLRVVPRNSYIASIAQLAEHVLRKHKVTSSILVGGSPVVDRMGRWSRGMILPSGGRGRGFDSRTAPLFFYFILIFFFIFFP